MAVASVHDRPILFCLACGAYATARPKALLAPCDGFPATAGIAEGLRSIRKGWSPATQHKRAECPWVPLCSPEAVDIFLRDYAPLEAPPPADPALVRREVFVRSGRLHALLNRVRARG